MEGILFSKLLKQYWWLLIIPVVLIIASVLLNRLIHQTEQKAIQQERAETAGEALKRVEKGNAIRAKINDPTSRAKYDECMRSSARPENCKRYLPKDTHDTPTDGPGDSGE